MAVTHTETVNGKDYGFDFDDEEIEVDATANSVSADDLKAACRQAEASSIGIVWNNIIDTANPVTLDPVAGVTTAQNVILQRTWRILTLKTSGVFNMTGGNTVRWDTGVDIFGVNNLVTKVNIVSQASTRVNSATTDAAVLRIEQLLRNRQLVDSVGGNMEIMDDTNTSVLYEAPIYEDDGVTPWDGTGPIIRRDRFEEP